MGRVALLLTLLDRGDRPARARHVRPGELGLLGGVQGELVPVARHQAGDEGWLVLTHPALAQGGLQRPVLDGHEDLDLPLALDHQAHGHRLDPSR